ncbi:uncharacterized protein LOC126579981 isoform X1 [Anopheles aquasalis]|uniref:uncharacterized protein LOC126579981 isoform X1 n=1 Tax=Anopheles aquasalis TaxID=42839 RepID=UPI00215AE422|nr:uncharacterized protein LOC126579981 isoform X1 [Anopheles aquasalis]
MDNTVSGFSVFINGRTLSCLICPKSTASCASLWHPLQRVISYEELLGKYGRKVNRDQYDAIDIYTCPACGHERLSIEALYDHFRAEHHHQQQAYGVKGEFRCPVCVCFRLEDSTMFVANDLGLVGHLISRHCFASERLYSEEHELRSRYCYDDESELVRFLAIFLPPSTARLDSDCDRSSLSAKDAEQLECPICLEQIDGNRCRRLSSCSHQFHDECIDRWLEEKLCCPVCRTDCSGSRRS